MCVCVCVCVGRFCVCVCFCGTNIEHNSEYCKEATDIVEDELRGIFRNVSDLEEEATVEQLDENKQDEPKWFYLMMLLLSLFFGC